MSSRTKSAYVSVKHDDGTVIEYEIFENSFTTQDADEPRPTFNTTHFIAGRTNHSEPFRKMDVSEIDDFDFCIIMDAINKAPGIEHD